MCTMRTTLSIILAALCLVSCASTSPTYEDAEDALKAGQFEEAHRMYLASAEQRPWDPMIREKVDLSRTAALKSRLDAARRAEKDGDLNRAQSELDAAERWDRDGETVAREKERLTGVRARVEQELARARSLSSWGRNREAAAVLDSIEIYEPTMPEIGTLRSRVGRGAARDSAVSREGSQNATANRLVDLARGEMARGNAGAALAVLDRGSRSLGNHPVLTAGGDPIRAKVRDRLLARATAQERAGRHGAALLFALAATSADPQSTAAKAKAAGAETAARADHEITVKVERFSDGTRGRVDPGTFTREIAGALASVPGGAWLDFRANATGPDLILSGKVDSLEVETEVSRDSRKVHNRDRGVDQRLNPAHEEAEKRVARLTDDLRESQRRWNEVKEELYRLEKLEGSATTLQGGRRRFGDYNEVVFYRLLGDAKSREASSRRRVENTERNLSQARTALDATPLYIEKPIVDRVPYREQTVEKKARAVATWSLDPAPGSSGTTSVGSVADAVVTAEDTVRKGRPEVGLSPDPRELPPDAGLARLALRSLADRIAGAVIPKAAGFRLDMIQEARKREARGDVDGALDLYAAFILGAGDMFPLEKSTAALRIREHWGLDVTDRTVTAGGFRFE